MHLFSMFPRAETLVAMTSSLINSNTSFYILLSNFWLPSAEVSANPSKYSTLICCQSPLFLYENNLSLVSTCITLSFESTDSFHHSHFNQSFSNSHVLHISFHHIYFHHSFSFNPNFKRIYDINHPHRIDCQY